MSLSFARLLIACAVLVLSVVSGLAQRTFGGMYTQQRLANIRANAQTDSAVIAKKNAAVSAAAPWLAMSDEQLWSMVPAQSLPRCIDVTWDYDFPNQLQLGCLNCGDGIKAYGNYPYNPDFKNKPWKLTCPNCGIVFPTNDFGAYYRSGINSRGEFDPAIANKALLYNTAHPSPSDPLYKYGVDDGYGYVDGNGRQHKFIAYYAWKYWRYLQGGLSALADAYMYTGDPQYARKAAILLDRIADEYPAMDWNTYAKLGWFHSDGGSKLGKIEGRIWETSQYQIMVEAYDKIISGTVDNPALYSFLQQKAGQFTLPGVKGTRQGLIDNIDTGLLRTGSAAIKAKRIWGNEGMHQSAMAYAGVALNTEPETSQWLDWIFAAGANNGHLPTMLVQLFDRDGMANEGAPSYNFLWPGQLMEILSVTEPYTAYTNHRVTRDYPWFRNAFTSPWRVQALNTFTPNIGDTGATGLIDLGFNATLIAQGFKYFGDPTAARFAWEANGYKATGLLTDSGSTTPDALNQALASAALSYPERPRLGEHLAGYGLATAEFGTNSAGKALWCYYGRSTGHGHLDRLNFGLYAFNTDLSPDLGYPEFASSTYAPRNAWNHNTLSHNTVVVNKSPQAANYTGFPQFYTAQPGYAAWEIESANVYSGVSDYRRTMAFIQVPDGNAYAVDVFRVSGGTDHLMSFHGPPGAVQVGDGSFQNQATGTYAGPTVEYGDNSTAYPLGYSYLKNVTRAVNPPSTLWLDWKAQAGYRGVTASDNLHLRMHVLTPLSDIALADGIPPQNKPGNPASIRYALLHREAGGAQLNSQFVSVYEPWKNSNFINSVTRLALTDAWASDVVALRVDLKNQVTDYLISNPARKNIAAISGPATDAQFAWLRTQNGQVTSATLTRGTFLNFDGITVQGRGEVAGQIASFERDISKPACAWITMSSGNAQDLVGNEIIISNDRAQTACYNVVAAEPAANNQWKITCEPGTFVRGFVDANDYSKGYSYNISNGAGFTSPQTVTRFSAGESQVMEFGQY